MSSVYRAEWFHRLIAAHLDAVEAGLIDRLMIFLPPRHGKSHLSSVSFPAYYLGRNPDRRVILSSYSAHLAGRFAGQARDQLQSPRWPFATRLSAKSSARAAWDIEGHRGGLISAGVRGSITGAGANLALIDDPFKDAKEANSLLIRDSVWEWYQSTLYTRLEDSGAIVLIMTRWHPDDLAGRLLAAHADGSGDRWVILNLPAIAETDEAWEGFGGRRRGDALWPSKYPVDKLQRIEQAVGEYVWASLYQQRPTSAGGSIFLREWWEDANRFDAAAGGHSQSSVARFISWDTAVKDGEDNAYSARIVGELTADYRLKVREVWRGRLQLPGLLAEIERSARRWGQDGKLRSIIIEDKASGTGAIQTLRAGAPEWLAGLLHPFQPDGNKEARAHRASVWCANGSVLLPRPSEAVPWLADFEGELFDFPRSTYADQVDAFNQLVDYLRNYLAEGHRGRMDGLMEGVRNGTV